MSIDCVELSIMGIILSVVAGRGEQDIGGDAADSMSILHSNCPHVPLATL